MRIATLQHPSRPRVGRPSAERRRIERFEIDGSRGALALIEGAPADAAPPALGGSVALADAGWLEEAQA